MGVRIKLDDRRHKFTKQNLVTIADKRRGGYDQMKCEHCGLLAKRFGLDEEVELNGKMTKKKQRLVDNCDGSVLTLETGKIRVTFCTAGGSQFANCIPGSEHTIVSPPAPQKADGKGVWIQGIKEPVKLLNGEFTRI